MFNRFRMYTYITDHMSTILLLSFLPVYQMVCICRVRIKGCDIRSMLLIAWYTYISCIFLYTELCIHLHYTAWWLHLQHGYNLTKWFTLNKYNYAFERVRVYVFVRTYLCVCACINLASTHLSKERRSVNIWVLSPITS